MKNPKWSNPKGRKPVPRFKNIGGKRYRLSSQDISKSEAKQLAKQLRYHDRFYTQVIPMKGSYRVYSKRRKPKKKLVKQPLWFQEK